MSASDSYNIAPTAQLPLEQEQFILDMQRSHRESQGKHIDSKQMISSQQRDMFPSKTPFAINCNSRQYNRALFEQRKKMRAKAQKSGKEIDYAICILNWHQNPQSTLSIPIIDLPFGGRWVTLDDSHPERDYKVDCLTRMTAQPPLPEPEYGDSVSQHWECLPPESPSASFKDFAGDVLFFDGVSGEGAEATAGGKDSDQALSPADSRMEELHVDASKNKEVGAQANIPMN